MLVKLIFFGLFQLVSSECTNMLFLEHSTHTKQITKSESITVSPAIDWKDNIIRNTHANEIFKNLDFDKYELMTHAYKGSLIIHRVCEKGTDYPKYGKITNTEMRGYVVDVRDMFITDMFLNNNHFTTYAHGHQRYNFNRYKIELKEKERQQMIKKRQEYKQKNPIKYFIYFIVIKYSFYAFITYVIKYLTSYPFIVALIPAFLLELN